ncbi:MAG: DMT family transporter, partial [Streptococcus sp.]|nr:DMT family transporter [Streptococcus sp.]
MRHKIILGCFAAAACESLFGPSFIFTKSITAQASGLALISWRFVTAFFFVNLYLLARRRRVVINGRNLRPLTRIAILNPIIYFICETIGIRMTTASESGAFLACIPVVALIMSSLIL